MGRADLNSRQNRVTGLFLGLIVAIVFLGLSMTRLDGQGLYYDEAHQAPAAFFYIGEHPSLFTYPIFGVPVLNMAYTGAIKSAVYGVYLRTFGGHFTVYSWRLLGLLFVAFGLFFFYRTGATWPLWSSILFGVLFLTDTSVLLMARHDWGPVALSLGLRLAFLGLWIALDSEPTQAKGFLAGFIVGIAIFEKLSAVVLIIPFSLLLWSLRRRSRGVLNTAVTGFVLGTLPLLLVNLASYIRGAGLISLAEVKSVRAFHLQDAINFAREFLALGQGVGVRELVLGDSATASVRVEVLLVLILMAIVLVAVWRRTEDPEGNRWTRLAACCASSYILIALALFLFPQQTDLHHWILGTPFQYAAIAATFTGLRSQRVLQTGLVASVLALAVVRVPNVVAVEQQLEAGKASQRFDPEFTRVAEISAAKSANAAFVAADWGMATQLYCMNNGKPDSVYETYWGQDPAGNMQEVLKRTMKPEVYVLVAGISPQFADASAAILQAVTKAPDWQEMPVDKEFDGLHRIRVRKFVRRR